MRKSILPILLACLALASCKKTYTCSCVTTEVDTDPSTGATQTLSYKNTTIAYSEKMSESQAKSACSHEETGVQSNFDAILTGNGTHAQNPDVKFSTSCQLN